MIKIFSAKKEYRNEVISLWQKCFGDDEAYISFFIDNCPDHITVGYFTDDKLVSMFFLLESNIDTNRCKYLYAACTDMSYRKQGIMEKLINYAKDYCADLGYSAIFLVPATENLYLYYSKFGFISSFLKKKLTFKSYNHKNDSNFDVDNAESITENKIQLLNQISGFKFSPGIINYTVHEHLFNGGKIAYCDDSNRKAIAFYYKDGNDIVVKELLTDFHNLDEAVEKLFSNKTAENIYIYAPIVYNSTDIVEEYTKCGMCLPLNNEFSVFLQNNSALYAGMYLD